MTEKKTNKTILIIIVLALLLLVAGLFIINNNTNSDNEKKTINYDNMLIYADCSNMNSEDVQNYIDNDYVVMYRGDYNHHASGMFQALCDTTEIGDNIILNGKQYEVISKETGKVINNNVYINDVPVYDNGITQILHCLPEPGDRFVMTLKETTIN